MTRAYITGASGFIGRNLEGALVKKGWEVFKPRSKYYRYEYDAPQVPMDYIFHCADVQGNAQWADEHCAEQFTENLAITQSVLNFWLEHQKQATFVGFNSLWAYPDFNTGFGSDGGEYYEDEFDAGPMNPITSHYGIMKKLLVEGINAYKRQYGMKGTMLTLGNVYGPYDKSERLIPTLIKKMLAQPDEIEVYGDATDEREFCFIEDQIAAIITARDCPHTLINANAGMTITIGEVEQKLCKLLDFSGILLYKGRGDFGSGSRTLDNSKYVNMYGHKRLTPLEDALAKTIKWFREGIE